MASRDANVNLVIKARDEAKRVLDSLNAGLDQLSKSQEKAGKSADKAGDLVSQLGDEFQTLNRQLQGLAALGKIAGEMDKAATAVARIDSEVKSSAQSLADLARESQAAEQRTNRLRAQLEIETRARDENTAALRVAKKELANIDKLLRQVENSQSRLNKTATVARTPGVGLDEGVRRSDARASAAVFLADEQRRLTGEVTQYTEAVDRSKRAVKDLSPAVTAAANQQDRLATQTEKSAAALRQQREALTGSRENLNAIRTISDQANARLGDLAGTQDKVAAASARMAAQMAAAKARIDGLANAKPVNLGTQTTGIAGDEQALGRQRRAMLETRREWVAAQEEVRRLAIEMRNAEQPTEELGRAFGEAQARARLAKEAYEQQATALHRLGGAAQSNFREFSQAANQMRAASTATGHLAGNVGAAVSAQDRLAEAGRRAGQGMDAGARGSRGMRDALREFYGESRQAMSFMQRLRGEVLSLVTAYVGLHAAINAIGGVISSFQTIEAAQSRLGVVFNQDTARVSKELAFLNSEASRLGITFQILSDEYGKFAVAASAANFSAESTRKIFISVAEAARVNKLSVDQMSGVFLALQQMISKGKVSSEELRRQLGDRLTGAFNIFAEAIGVTTAELDAMMRAGEVVADEGTLLKFADELNERFGPQLAAALRTTTTEIGKFQNELFNAQVRVAEGGFIEGLTEGLRELNEWFASREGRDFFLTLGKALGGFIQLLAQVPDHFAAIQVILTAIIALKFGQAIGRMSTGFLQATTGATTFRAALVSLRTSAVATMATLTTMRGVLLGIRTLAQTTLAFFGGIPGIIAAGVVSALSLWIGRVDDATSALDEHQRQLDEVNAAYLRAGKGVENWAKDIKGVSLLQAQDDLAKMQQTLADLRKQAEAPVDAFGLDTNGTVANIQRTVDAFKAGEISAEQFKSRVDIIAAMDPKFSRDLALGLQSIADEAVSVEERVAKAEAKLRLIQGTATDADMALLGLAEATEQANEAFGQTDINKYNDAIETLKKSVPELAAELKELKAAAEIDAAGLTAFAEAMKSGDIGKITEALDLYGRAVNAQRQARQNTMLDAYGAGSDSVIERIIYIEGGQNGGGPSTSSARGIGQFTEGTWLGMFDRIFPELRDLNQTQKLALRTSREHATKMLEALTRENQAQLLNAGVGAGPAETYLAHFLGAGDAIKVLLANPDELAANIVKRESVAANPSVFKPGLTIRDLINWSGDKMGGGSPITSTGQTEREQTLADQRAATDQRIADLQFQIDQQKLINDGKAKQAAIEAAITEARKENPDITDAEIAKIREQTAALYEQQHVGEALKLQREQVAAAEEKVNQLYQLRQQLLEQQQLYTERGDTTSADALTPRLQEVNTQLQAATQNAIRMWQAIGGPEADAAIAKLQTTALSVQDVGTKVTFLGLSMDQVKQLGQSFASGLAGVFDKFAAAIANGEDATKALGDAFLQFAADFLRQIAQMIIQQAILNALQGFMGGGAGGGAGGIGGFFASMFHSGGVAGRGGSARQIDPSIFANALRYHSGGVAGLKPNEVPTILERNEEILTTDDPRHQFNGGGAQMKAGDTKIVNAFDTASFLEAALATRVGEKAILNFVQANAGAIKGALG